MTQLARDFNAAFEGCYIIYTPPEGVPLPAYVAGCNDTSGHHGDEWDGIEVVCDVYTLGSKVLTVGDQGVDIEFPDLRAVQIGRNVLYPTRKAERQWKRAIRSTSVATFSSNEGRTRGSSVFTSEVLLNMLSQQDYEIMEALKLVRADKENHTYSSQVISKDCWLRREGQRVELYYRGRPVAKVFSNNFRLYKSAAYLKPRFSKLYGEVFE